MLKVVALDFDGTLVESNSIKDIAFDTIFSAWPTYKEAMMKWHIENNAVDRREKFRYFVVGVLGLPNRPDLIDDLVSRFGQLTTQAVIKCPFVPGAREFLEFTFDRHPMYLLSATPHSILMDILTSRDIDQYFEAVYGAPIDKAAVLNDLMIEYEAKGSETLFIGYSKEDQQVAKSLGIDFIGRYSGRELEKDITASFSNMFEILKYAREKHGL